MARGGPGTYRRRPPLRAGAMLLFVWAMLVARAALAADASPHVTAAMPADFAAVATTQRAVVDVFVAGRRVGQFAADVGLKEVRLLAPAALAAAIPDVRDPARLTAALGRPLPIAVPPACDGPSACVPVAGSDIVASYAADSFRLTLTLDPGLLAIRGTAPDYLEDGWGVPSAIDSIGVVVAGGGGPGTAFAVRNRFVARGGPMHLVADASLSSWDGAQLDTLAADIDRRDLRLRGGLFYAPGADLVGRRRILGVGVATQFDTRADRVALTGTPLVVFLARRARVDVYVQGRLVSSQVYDGGNQSLDTSGLPDGSYPVELHIQDIGGATRVEQRFFSKSAALAPVGRVMFDVQFGLLARHRGEPGGGIAIATGSARGRMSPHLAWDVAAMTTRANSVVEAGLSLLSPLAQVRVAALGATRGDRGVAAQASASGGGPLGFNLDLRHVRSATGTVLIAADTTAREAATPLMRPRATDAQAGYTQLLGNLSYALPKAQLGMSAFLFRSSSRGTAYSIGPTARWSVLQRDRLHLSVNGTFARTHRGSGFALGLQFQLAGPRAAISGVAGIQREVAADGDRLSPVLETAATLHRDGADGSTLDAGALVQRNAHATIVQLTGERRGAHGMAGLSLTARPGTAQGIQYGITAQTSFGLAGGGPHLAAGGQNDSMIAVAVDGEPSALFELLVNDAVRGTVRGGQRVALAVQPYRRYRIRLRAIAPGPIVFDTRARTVDVFPGSVAALTWTARAVRAMFGRLVDARGMPIGDADVTTTDAIAASDPNGYFQIEASADALLTARTAAGATCSARLRGDRATTPFTRLGDVTCLP